MIAVKRLQSLFWILLVTIGALAAYLVTLSVANERNNLNSVRKQLAKERADIRYLETEFLARASMRQLERWNAEDFRYAAPQASQYLTGATAFAMLDQARPSGDVYVAPPVMTAMVSGPQDAPATRAEDGPSPASTQLREEFAIVRTAQAAVPAPANGTQPMRASTATSAPKQVASLRVPNPAAQRAERMAMLDAQLLDDRTLGEIAGRAAAEGRKGVR